MEQALDSSSKIDEGAVPEDRHDAAGQDGAWNDGPADLLGLLGFLFLEEGAPRYHQPFALLFEFENPERVDLPHVDRGIGGEAGVNLRDRAEGPLPGNPDLESPLDLLSNASLHGEPGPECFAQSLPRGGTSGELVGERQSADRRDHQGLDSVSDLCPEVAIRIPQLLEGDGGFALSPDVDECHFRPDRHDGPL